MRHRFLLLLPALLLLGACASDEATGPTATTEALQRPAPPVEVPVDLPATPTIYFAVLSGEDAGVDTHARGTATFHVAADGASIDYRLVVANLLDVTMAHIHLAPMGENGPPVVWLYPDSPPMQLIEGRTSGVLAEGTITADDLVGPLEGMTLGDLIAAMDEGRTYVNVHTEAYPAGEIRDRIHTGGLNGRP